MTFSTGCLARGKSTNTFLWHTPMRTHDQEPRRWLRHVGVVCCLASLSFAVFLGFSTPEREAEVRDLGRSTELSQLAQPSQDRDTDSNVFRNANWLSDEYLAQLEEAPSPRPEPAVDYSEISATVFEQLHGVTVGTVSHSTSSTEREVRRWEKLYEERKNARKSD